MMIRNSIIIFGMDMKPMEGHPEGCKCGMCQGRSMMGGMCGHHHWSHLLVKVVLAIFIFWCGVQFGELRGMLGHGFGYQNEGMMGWYGSQGQGAYRGPAMMYGINDDSSAARPATTTTAR